MPVFRRDVGGRAAELAAEGVGEVAVTGKAEFEGEGGDIVRALRQAFERSAKAEPGQVAMDWHSGSLLKNASEMEGRREHSLGDIVERDAFALSAREVDFGRLGAVRVIGIGTMAPAFARHSVSSKRGFEHIGDELKRRHIGPERFERIGFGGFQALHELRDACQKTPASQGPVTKGNGRSG